MRRAKISGAGMAVPERRVTNKDLEAMMDTSDEWIVQRSGIQERRWVSEGETPADLAEAATHMACERAGIDAAELECLIVPTLSSQYEFPGTSFFLQERLGGTTPCFDLRAQCTGFIFSLSVANALVVSGQYRRVLVCGAEVHSTGLDKTSEGRDVTVLFGDGAGAVVVEAADDDEEAGLLNVTLHAQGKHAEKLWVPWGSARFPSRLDAQGIEERLHFPRMDGRHVFKNAVTRMPEVLGEALDAAGIKQPDVDLFLFHQANLRINEFVANALEIPPERVRNNIQRYGNCSAASIPILLSEAWDEGLIEPGKLVSMTGFGSGFSWGSALVRF